MMTYRQETIVEKNITLSFEFERYLLEHPEMLEQMPPEAEIVLLPQDDPELYRINLEAARSVQPQKNAPPIIYVEIEALAPSRSRLVNPHLTPKPGIDQTYVEIK